MWSRPSSLSLMFAGVVLAAFSLSVQAQVPLDQFTDQVVEPTSGWTFIPGAEAPTASSFVEWNGELFMGTWDTPTSYVNSGAVFRSSDDGMSWAHAQLAGPIRQLVTTSHTIVANVHSGALYYSTDGQSWQLPTPAIGGVAGSLTSTRDMVFAMTGHYGGTFFHRSFDGGQTFENLPMPVFGFAQLQAMGRYLFAGTSDGLFRSSDFGETWHPVVSFPHPVIRLAEVDRILFVVRGGTSAGLYRSADYGTTWEYAGNGLPNAGAGLLQALTLHQGSVYMSVTGATGWSRGVYVSHDGGYTWTRRVIPGLSDQHIPALHSTGEALLAGTGEGTFRTEDGGTSWSRSDEGASAVIGVSGIHVSNGRILVGTDIGINWGRGIWRSDDLGTSWAMAPQFPTVRATTFVPHGNALLAGGAGSPRGTIRSSDGGANWVHSNTGMWAGTILYDLLEHDGTLFAAAHNALYRSLDGGHTWIEGEPSGLRSLARYGDALYGAHDGVGVFRSTDGGQSWTLFAQGLTGAGTLGLQLLVHEGQLFLGTDGLGVWRLDGEQWTHIGPGNARVTTLVSTAGSIVVGARTAPYLWALAGGTHWEPFDKGIVPRQIQALFSDGEYIYAGLPLQGLWRRHVANLPTSQEMASNTAQAPAQLPLLSVYPNPVSASATLAVRLESHGPATVQLLDMLGREVARWVTAGRDAGVWRQVIDTSHLAAGHYLVRATAGDHAVVQRLTVIR